MRRLAAAAVLIVVGGLGGCPTVDVGETPVSPPLCRPDFNMFKDPGGIWDIAIAPPDASKSCTSMDGCHTADTGRSALRLIAKPRDQLTDSDWQFNYDVVTRFLNCSEPEASLFITKPEAGVESHLGGDLWICDSANCEPERTIEAWIASR